MSMILSKSENGKVNIVYPCDCAMIEYIADELKKRNIEYIITENPNIDNLFFDAYLFSKNGAILDFNLAKDIWLDHYRRARTPLLEKLDLEYMRADEQGNLELKKEIAVKKQALRDVTKTELPDTLEGIKNTWPEILGVKPF